MPPVLGVDIGTTNVKGILIDENQEILATASHPLRIERPRRHWSEQRPQAWWSAFLAVCGKLRHRLPKVWADVSSIGLTGQMHAAVCLDESGRPLRPAILWNDARARAECAELAKLVPNLHEIAGVIPMAGFTAPKVLWLRRHEPKVFDRIAHVVFAKDFVRLKLTGEYVTDMSDAAGSLWLDVRARQWSAPIVAAGGLLPTHLPRLAEGPDVSATLLPSIARKLGLPKGVVLAAGAGDVAAGALGIGAIAEGDSFLSLGTSGQYFVVRERFTLGPDPTVHSFAHCLLGRWYQMAALLNGASCLEWICRILGVTIGAALADVEKTARSPSPALFLPYLAGERTPHNDPDLRAAFLGVGHATTRANLVQSVLEGVALSFADVEDRLQTTASGGKELPVVGGAARSTLWVQILADVLGRDLVLYRNAEAAAPLGAARLARMALTREPPRSVCLPPKISKRIRPRASWHDEYVGILQEFRRSIRVSRLRPARHS